MSRNELEDRIRWILQMSQDTFSGKVSQIADLVFKTIEENEKEIK